MAAYHAARAFLTNVRMFYFLDTLDYRNFIFIGLYKNNTTINNEPSLKAWNVHCTKMLYHLVAFTNGH